MKLYRILTENEEIQTVTDFDGHTGLVVSGSFASGYEVSENRVTMQRLLAPVDPPTVFCIGLNYRQHAAEVGATPPAQPIVFLKSPTAVIGEGAAIVIPNAALKSEKTDYECELAVVIGRDCKDATEATALDYVAGYTCANDVSARDWQLERSGGQWCRGKTFDTFCPLGPAMVTSDELPDPQTLAIRTRLNGRTMQDSHTSDMIFSVREIIAFLSADTTLKEGTVILTGTPQGVGIGHKPPVFLQPGDVVEIEIEGIGILRNPVS